ncbi:PQQ-dependent sugar dehydrogenase [Galbibacter pacificus]|uniref:PQQ-dependent sugar dehydrogenase n=1 Tax=Galbibacter pacificus TaxID=2996052 RepID=A0ABT6FNT8_9FLAO|nr:PQQ-dependent sugar dehydrogenase [Galbibacter pacificus]MDG3581447.1 PQQ-dependent sugar dehydrogenase [Galbibacter pacificus]MDG3584925.1 PQQ-dependent sugar dehydrogenase [Galbibacter pacificus]
MKHKILLILIVIIQFSCAQDDKTITVPEEITYTLETVVSDINIPWGMAFLPDGKLLVTEKSGKLYLVENGNKTEISHNLTVYDRGQGGLMDVKLHPDYKNNGWIYFSYASDEGDGSGGNTAIARAKLNGNALTGTEVLYMAEPNTTKGQHFGSRIEFDDNGYLYFSIGERGERDVNPQDITRDGGKIYRLYDDGRIPEDNPFIDSTNAKKAIYSYGHRNPQGMLKHYQTGDIWVHEHGPQGGDEINVIKKGANYGWPVISYGENYDGTSFTDITEKEGMEQPLHYWVPSIAPSGMAFVTSDVYPGWKGSLMVGSLKFGYLERMVIEGNAVTKREKLVEGEGRMRNVKQGPDGYLYLGIEGSGIVKIVPEKK